MFRRQPADRPGLQLHIISPTRSTSATATASVGTLERPKLHQRHRRKLLACLVCLLAVLAWFGYAVGAAINLLSVGQCLSRTQQTSSECFALQALNVSGLCSAEARIRMEAWADWRAFSSVIMESVEVQLLTASGEELMTVSLLTPTRVSSGSNDLMLEWALHFTDPSRLASTARAILESNASLTLRASVRPISQRPTK